MRLCILFPGIGYHCDKPLLYYSAKLARNMGYEVRALKFYDFPEGAKGNAEKMRRAAEHALRLAEEQLADADFSAYDEVVLIGKSIGTKAALAYREKYGLHARAILLTPLEMTYEHDTRGCTAFHGTSDQWADTSEIVRLSREHEVPLFEYKRANHSIETGDVFLDLDYLRYIMDKISHFLKSSGAGTSAGGSGKGV